MIFDSKQARWELEKERVKRIMDAKNVCADAGKLLRQGIKTGQYFDPRQVRVNLVEDM
uniref:Uncharacterized protein n=1 Tax=Helianthus annuus TaxID=4232 RepID=A0A251S7D4_HELAN